MKTIDGSKEQEKLANIEWDEEKKYYTKVTLKITGNN